MGLCLLFSLLHVLSHSPCDRNATWCIWFSVVRSRFSYVAFFLLFFSSSFSFCRVLSAMVFIVLLPLNGDHLLLVEVALLSRCFAHTLRLDGCLTVLYRHISLALIITWGIAAVWCAACRFRTLRIFVRINVVHYSAAPNIFHQHHILAISDKMFVFFLDFFPCISNHQPSTINRATGNQTNFVIRTWPLWSRRYFAHKLHVSTIPSTCRIEIIN